MMSFLNNILCSIRVGIAPSPAMRDNSALACRRQVKCECKEQTVLTEPPEQLYFSFHPGPKLPRARARRIADLRNGVRRALGQNYKIPRPTTLEFTAQVLNEIHRFFKVGRVPLGVQEIALEAALDEVRDRLTEDAPSWVDWGQIRPSDFTGRGLQSGMERLSDLLDI